MTTSDIKERLRGYNTPDRTLDNQRHIAVDIHDALNEIERLERELAALQEESRQWDKTSLVAILARAEKAERELAESVDTIYALITYPEAHGALAAKARAGFLKSRLEAAARDAEILAKAYLVAETVKQPREEK